MSAFVDAEIASQPACWAAVAGCSIDALPQPGERVAAIGCGTSWFMAMSYAAARERAGLGETDAFSGSEMPADRRYDRVVAISRSGTTTEIVDALRATTAPAVVLTEVAATPVTAVATDTILLDFADERSVVQTRFATTALALLRASLGADLAPVIADGERALSAAIEPLLQCSQVTFLGRGATIGLAHEAALKAREAARFWAESYPAMDYRHGPIAIAEPGRLVWCLGPLPDGLADAIAETGATLYESALDPLAQLVVAQRLAVELARARGLDPDRPRSLTRSVVLA